MAMIKFWRGAAAPQERNADTLYFDKSGKLYLGETLIADVTVLDTNTVNGLISTALASYYTKTQIDEIIAALDAEVKGEGTYVDVTVREVDGKITAVAIDDSAIDTKLADYQPKGDYQPAGDYKTKQTAVADAGLTGAKVLKNLSQDVNGVISYETRDLTPADIGAEAAGTAAGLIAELDAEKSSAAVEAGKGVQVTVKEVDGKIDEVTVSGNYDNLYDAKGAAATAEQNAKDYTDSEIIGLEFDLSEDGKTLKLKNKAGTEVATLDTTDFVVDGMLTSVVADQTNNKLTFTWNTVSGIQETEIELSSIADIYTGSSNVDEVNVVVSNTNEISATIGANVKTNIAKGVEAYGWGNHASEGYAKTADISNDIAKGVTAHGWGDHSAAGYAIDADLGDLAKKNEADLDLKALAHKTIAEKSDLADDVQTSLALADSAVQPGDIGTAAAKNVEFFDIAGAAAAVQGSTINTVKDCVDAINTMNNNVEGALGEVKNIVEMLTWIEV